MNMIPADTTIEAVRKQIEILRRMRPEARLKMAFELSEIFNVHEDVLIKYPFISFYKGVMSYIDNYEQYKTRQLPEITPNKLLQFMRFKENNLC